MAAGNVYNPSAAKDSPRAAGHFPGFVQLLSRQAARLADGAANAIEQRRTWKPLEIVIRQPRP